MNPLEERIRQIFRELWTERRAGGVYDAFSHNLRRYDGPECMRYGRESLVRELAAGFGNSPRTLDSLLVRGELAGAAAAALEWSVPGAEGEAATRGLSFWYLSDGIVTEVRDAPGEASPPDEPILDLCFCSSPGELERTDGQGRPKSPAFTASALDSAQAIDAFFCALWNRRDLGLLPVHYAADAQVDLPDGSHAEGPAAVEEFVVGVLTALPDALYVVDDLIMGPDGSEAALRWTIQGTDATGRKRIRIGGQSRVALSGGKISGETVRMGRGTSPTPDPLPAP